MELAVAGESGPTSDRKVSLCYIYAAYTPDGTVMDGKCNTTIGDQTTYRKWLPP